MTEMKGGKATLILPFLGIIKIHKCLSGLRYTTPPIIKHNHATSYSNIISKCRALWGKPAYIVTLINTSMNKFNVQYEGHGSRNSCRPDQRM